MEGSNATTNDTVCIPLNDTEDWRYRNESMDVLFKLRPYYMNKTECEIEHGMQEMCQKYTGILTFDDGQLARVIITWTLFFISAIGNSFVIYCVYARARTSHVHLIMLHFAIADLAFTLLVSPKDAIWNTTMQWYGGAVLCKICQMCTQIGMYVSSFMLVVMALDRYCGIVLLMRNSKQRTRYLVAGAWILSILCASPAVYVFNLVEMPYCPDHLLKQCIDYAVLTPAQLRPYNFFTMAMSFLVPMILCVILYCLVACEITNMIKRDRDLWGRRDSCSSVAKARKKTLMMTSLVTLTFLLFWGPYYAVGVHYWFYHDEIGLKAVATPLFILLYFHPAIHPFLYGLLMSDVRETFRTVTFCVRKILTCSKIDIDETRRRQSSKSNGDNVLTNTTILRAPDCHLAAEASPSSGSLRGSPSFETELVERHGEHDASNSATSCISARRDRMRELHKSNATCGIHSVRKAQLEAAGQIEDHVTDADEQVRLINGNVTRESTRSTGNTDGNGNTTRTSVVTFQLPGDSKLPTTDLGLNNNKEALLPNSDGSIIADSSV